ncbi:hypothetical protein [Streptomyces sp. bgisy029]|uniref:hypothetical protein n=1 Tax=Streptomyces sp. bgisy029 TaxID=3413771 RepID=UPI003D7156B1
MDELLSINSDSVTRFLQRWYGTGDSTSGDLPDATPHAPDDLVRWHAAAALTGHPVTFADRPVAPQDLAPDSRGMLEFWIENQNGYFWAVGLDDDGLQVFSRKSGEFDWRATGEPLGEFLLHCTVREAVIGSESKFTTFIGASEIEDALDSFKLLKFSALDSEEPEVKLWCSEDALVRMAPPPTGYAGPGDQLWMLTFAAPSDWRIERYASRFGLEGCTDKPAHTELPYEPPPF